MVLGGEGRCWRIRSDCVTAGCGFVVVGFVGRAWVSPGPWAGWEGRGEPGPGGRFVTRHAAGGGMVLGGDARGGPAGSGCVDAAWGRVGFGAAGRAGASPWPWAWSRAGFGKRGPVGREEFCAIKIYLLPALPSVTDSTSLSPSPYASAAAAPLWGEPRVLRRTAFAASPSLPWSSCLLSSFAPRTSFARVPAGSPPSRT